MSTVFGSKYSSLTSHRAQIPSSSDEVSSDGSELEFARSNDDDDEDSSQVEDQQEQGGGIRGRGCMPPTRRDRGRGLGRGCKQRWTWDFQSSNVWNGVRGILVESHRISSY